MYGKHPHKSTSSPHHKSDKFQFNSFQIIKLIKNQYDMVCPTPIMRLPINSFFYLISGEIMVAVGDDAYLLKANEVILIPAGQPFIIKYYNESVGFMGGFSPDFMIDFSQNTNEIQNVVKFFSVLKFQIKEEQANRIEFLMNTIYDLFSLSVDNKELIKSYLSCFLSELNRSHKCSDDSKNMNLLTYKFLELLFDTKNRSLRANEYAQILKVSPNHLNKTVKKATSKSVSLWIDEVMVFEAKVLIRNTSLTIGEIAERLGIFDQSYFSRKFKQFEKLSPSDYRNK